MCSVVCQYLGAIESERNSMFEREREKCLRREYVGGEVKSKKLKTQKVAINDDRVGERNREWRQ